MTSAATSRGARPRAPRDDSVPDLFDARATAHAFWESSNALLVVVEADSSLVLGCNPTWKRLLGWAAAELVGTPLLDLVHPTDVRHVVEALDAPSGAVERLEVRMCTAAGSYVSTMWNGTVEGGRWSLSGRDLSDALSVENGLRDVAGRWHEALDVIAGQVCVIDERGDLVAVNDAWRRAARQGGKRADGLDRNYFTVLHQEIPESQAAEAAEGLRAVLDGGRDDLSVDYPVDDRWFTMHATRFRGPGPARVVVSHIDMTGRSRRSPNAEGVGGTHLQESLRGSAALLDELDAAVISVDLEDRVTHWNRGAEQLFGASREDALGAPLTDLVTAIPDGGVVPTTLDGNRQISLRRRDGSVLAVQLRTSPLRGPGGSVVGSVSVCFDATAQRHAERAATKAQKHLRAVTDSMGEGLFALDSHGRVTVMNAAAEAMLGWSLAEIGGQTMHEVTHHRYPDGSPFPTEECALQRVHREGETLRLVADVFVRRDGIDLPVTYTAAPLDTDEEAHGCVVVFIDATEVHAEQQRLAKELNELAWVQRVRQVLDDDRFVLFAQPIINLDTGEVTQHELLLRVRRTDGTIAGPAEYLTTAEEHGLIGEIDRWVIQQSLARAADGMHVELNISASSVGDAALLEDIERWLDASGADPGLLVFEITETALIRDERAGRLFVQRLHELGCKVALDDFGTGYGGFTYLKQLPVDYLKIDTEFVLDLCDNRASLHVVSAVVNLAHGFGLKTVAEGVEDQRTLELLQELGVDFAQGYHIGRPGPMGRGPS